MAKRRRVACMQKSSKCGDQQSSVDRISMLPDELLVLILSNLTFKEARATSILSSRWRYLWTFAPKLDFDGSEFLSGLQFGERNKGLDVARRKYVRWVNQGIALHKNSIKNSTIEEFRVVFDLIKSDKGFIYKWLRYAISKQVQRLELNFTPNYYKYRDYNEFFTFPYKRLRKEKEKVSNNPQSSSVRPHNLIDFKYLKKISMYYVNVNSEALEFLLRSFPVLEDLCVFGSFHLSRVNIRGPFPSLKRLEISSCDKLESLEIRDANLVYLKYMGPKIDFLLDNVPMLVEVFVGESITCHMEDLVLMLSSYLPQLEILTIDVDNYPKSFGDTEIFYQHVKMSNLKQLTVKIYDCCKSLLPMTNLIRISPCLERFVLELEKNGISITELEQWGCRNIAWSYSHLKELELLGYGGLKTEVELIMHFVENAVALEKILINPRKFPFKPDMARAFVKRHLTKIVPSRINLTFI